MSLVPIGVTIAEAAALKLISSIFVFTRSIGNFIADVTLEETHVDELAITEHPVEQGAAITDHSYKRPEHVTIRCGWSNSSLIAFGNPNYVRQIYSNFVDLQNSREPFDIFTGKRFYTNMLIERMMVTTDEKTENVLMMVVDCREVIIVSTQTVTVPPAANMKTPQLNAATQNTGTQTTQPAPNYNANASPQ